MSIRALITSCVLFAASLGQAHAVNLTCATMISHPMPALGAVLVADLDAGDQVTVTAGSGSSAYSVESGSTVMQCGFVYGGASCAGHVFTAPFSGTFTFEKTGGPIADTLSCAAGTGGGAAGGGSSAVPSATAAQTQSAFVTGQAATGAIGGAVANANGGTPAAVTRNGLFLSTSGASTALQAWLSLQARSYDGAVDGRSHEFTLGADFELGANTRLGLLLSSGKADLDVSGVAVDVDALSFGPYFKTRFGQHYELTGFYVFARPEYDIAGTSYRADRQAGGLNLTASYSWGGTEIDSFLGLSGFSEDHPAAGALAGRTVSGLTGSIGTRATFAQGAALRPYVSLGADFSQFDDGLGISDSHTSPRLGTGFTWNSDRGTFSMDLNGGRIIEDTRDIELRMKYNLNF